MASKHGSTEEIARAIAEKLPRAGLQADQREAGKVSSFERYQAVVLRSKVYIGNWLSEARHFVERHHETLTTLSVWLFSSGPLGAEDAVSSGDPPKLPELPSAAHARPPLLRR